MEVSSRKAGNVVIVSVSGRLDALTTADFEQECSRLIEEGANSLVLDFSGLEYISSVGLKDILFAAKKLKASAGRIAVCGLQANVREVFDITGFSAYVPVFASLHEALDETS